MQPDALSSKILPHFSPEAAMVVHTKLRRNSFPYFLTPNEVCFEQLFTQLKKIHIKENGVVITTGTERCFFLTGILGFLGFQGFVVIRDINLKVFWYNNAIILLLRLARDHKHLMYLANLIDQPDQDAFNQRVAEICALLAENKEIPEEMRNYYKTHLSNMLSLYLLKNPNEFNWRTCENFNVVNYHLPENEHLFHHLQTLAKAGHFLPTIGSINDFELVSRHFNLSDIFVVDGSNIPDYGGLDLPIEVPVLHTKVEWSKKRTTYFLNFYKPLSPAERKEFDELNKIFDIYDQLSLHNTRYRFDESYERRFHDPSIEETTRALCGYNHEVLEIMRDLYQKNKDHFEELEQRKAMSYF